MGGAGGGGLSSRHQQAKQSPSGGQGGAPDTGAGSPGEAPPDPQSGQRAPEMEVRGHPRWDVRRGMRGGAGPSGGPLPRQPGPNTEPGPTQAHPGPLPRLHPLLHSRQGTPLRTLRSQETGSHPSPSQEHLGRVLRVGEGTLCRGPTPQTPDRTGVLPRESSALWGAGRCWALCHTSTTLLCSPPSTAGLGGVQAKTRLQAKSLSSAANALCSQLTSVRVLKLPSQSLRPAEGTWNL